MQDERNVIASINSTPETDVIEDSDFKAVFDGVAWSVQWRWKNADPPELRNSIENYCSTKADGTKEKFDEKIQGWVEKGWLVECESQKGCRGILPLMAVVQENKNKVRPVLDFRELNEYIVSNPGADAAACNETLREWRKKVGPLKLVDLKSAYLQLHVDRSLWPYQRVRYNGTFYYLTRLGFGLNVAPKIMTKVLKRVLSYDEKIKRGTDSYIDDILVDESVVSANDVVKHLERYGLKTKAPVELKDIRVLGLSVSESEDGLLMFGRGNELPYIEDDVELTRRKVFSICGQLTGHYPVCGWLRVATSYVKRTCQGERWDDSVGPEADKMLREILYRVRGEDPVRGVFSVNSSDTGRVWCDASSLALGVVIEIGGHIVEDAAWLRKKNDASHINLSELEAVVKGLNLAMSWGLKHIEIVTDSVTVKRWLEAVFSDEHRLKVSGISEALVKRRLSLIRDMMSEISLNLSVKYIPSEKNKADILTRVKKTWLTKKPEVINVASVRELHSEHHFGVDRSLYLARLVNPHVTRNDVEAVVKNCVQCRTIDPAPIHHDKGDLRVSENWCRLALDVTHYRNKSFFTVVDCGPSRFTIWRKVGSENASDICENLQQIFIERGPSSEILTDNSTAFRSFRLASLCKKWGVKQRFRAAYRPEGNGIAERMHRTIKSLSERCGKCPMEITFWYNLAAKEGLDGTSSPRQRLFRYPWKHPECVIPIHIDHTPLDIEVGDSVVVKPPGGKCTSRWINGRVTGITSNNNVDVDGTPRHVLDVRRALLRDDTDGEEAEAEPVRRSTRERRPPAWLKDYER